MELFSPVNALNGIGPARARQLERMGIHTVYDLLTYFPRTYEDRTGIVSICDLTPGVPACFEAMVVSSPTVSHIRKGMDLTRCQVADTSGRLTVTFFNRSYVKDQLEYGREYVFYGTLQTEYGMQVTNPVFESAETAGTVTGRIFPIYPLTEGITNRLMVQCIRQALEQVGSQMPEVLPQKVRDTYRLYRAAEAYSAIHAPRDQEELLCAKRRLVFEEFFIFSAGLALMRAQQVNQTAAPCDVTCMDAFFAALPFALTPDQKTAIRDILRDLSSGRTMNRLVQGDVGSGKTMAAAAACWCVIQNGHQAAIMAPTEILAEQHAKTLQAILAPLGVQIALLTGSLSAAEKRKVRLSIEDGTAQLIIGTHALISEAVVFHDLFLVVADEQHRFGVGQRTRLTQKGSSPHLLVMSATPIPRTLALIAYGDLDISVIATMPPGRKAVKTYLVGEDMRARIHAFIRKQCAEGHQVYIICPAVEPSDDASLKSAESWAEALQLVAFPDLRVGLLHGKLKGVEKEAVLTAFASHQLDILVSTTVVEVGVDVPNATLMVIENAERFGLSQLHQLRGRVGRGSDQSYCVLFSDHDSEETKKRLQALCATNDGFRIAREDLAQRGPGDFFGSRQHGLPLMKVASLQMDLQTLQQAQQAAAEFITSAASLNAPELAPLKARIELLFTDQEVSLN